MNNKMFFLYLDALFEAKTDDERTEIFNRANMDYQHGEKISGANLERLRKVLIRL